MGVIAVVLTWLIVAAFFVSLAVAFFVTLWALWPPLAIGFALFAGFVVTQLLS